MVWGYQESWERATERGKGSWRDQNRRWRERKDRRGREKIKYERETELNRWQNDMEVCGYRIPTWQCLEEGKHFLSASSFNLDYRIIDYRL